ncbi:hypothetical protein Tco_1418837 [Tanacetum coccineum]
MVDKIEVWEVRLMTCLDQGLKGRVCGMLETQREMKGKGTGGSKQNPTKNQDTFVTKGELDEEDLSYDDNEIVEVKVLMALADDENVVVGKESDKNSEWVKISMRKSSTDDTKVSIPGVERPWLSKAGGFNLPNHDTSRILPVESQLKVIDSSVIVIDSSVTDYDSTDQSLVCSTPLPPPEKLVERGDGVAGIKRRRRDLSGDDVWILATASQCSRIKVNLEPSTWRRRQKHQATPSRRYAYIYKTDFRVLAGTDISEITRKKVKNGQARTRESEEYKKKPKNQSRSQKSQASVKSSQNGQTLVNKSKPIKDKTQSVSL